MTDAFSGLPEIMASLRSFGPSRRARQSGGSMPSPALHLRFFAPLLEARKAAARAGRPAEAVAAFDTTAMVARLDAEVLAFARECHPRQAPARRALEAELGEIVAPLRAALVRLGQLAVQAQVAGSHDASWQRWLHQLRAIFEVADTMWPLLDRALQPPPRQPRWRR